MLGSWIFYAVVVATTLTGALLMTQRGKSWVRRVRRKQWRKTKAETKDAWRAHRAARAQTPRGRVKAARKRNPKRLTVGHRRSPEDPTRTRKVARRTKAGTAKVAKAAVNRYRLAKANRTAKKTPRRELSVGPRLFPGEGSDNGTSQFCNHTTTRGTKCRNRVRNGKCAAGHISGSAA